MMIASSCLRVRLITHSTKRCNDNVAQIPENCQKVLTVNTVKYHFPFSLL